LIKTVVFGVTEGPSQELIRREWRDAQSVLTYTQTVTDSL